MISTTIPAVLAACEAAYSGLSEGEVAALSAALAHPSPVNRIVGAFDVLRDVSPLATEGLAALVGCAGLIAGNGWHGRAGDAAALLIARAADIAALPQPETFVPPP